MSNINDLNEKTKMIFPRLEEGQYRKTSQRTPAYNCVAFAAGDEKYVWQPPECGLDGAIWPIDAPHSDELDTYITMFEMRGYVRCESRELEPHFDKVALYWGRKGIHVAKQKGNGKWKSKLGVLEDIEHDTLEALETDGAKPAYGHVQQILKRHVSEAAIYDTEFI